MKILVLGETISTCTYKPINVITGGIKMEVISLQTKWEECLKRKVMEDGLEKEAKVFAYDNLIGILYMFNVALFAYCSYSNRNGVKQEDYDTLYAQFDEIKFNFKKAVNEVEEAGGVIPEELKNIVETTNVDKFTDFEEYKNFSHNIHSIVELL